MKDIATLSIFLIGTFSFLHRESLFFIESFLTYLFVKLSIYLTLIVCASILLV